MATTEFSGLWYLHENSKPKTELDWVVLRAKDTPGPGQYKQVG